MKSVVVVVVIDVAVSDVCSIRLKRKIRRRAKKIYIYINMLDEIARVCFC